MQFAAGPLALRTPALLNCLAPSGDYRPRASPFHGRQRTQENKSQSVAAGLSQIHSSGESTFQFVDNRPEVIAQRKLQEMANNNPQVSQLKAFQDMSNNSPQAKQAAQLQSLANNNSVQQQPIQKKENNTGLPDNLKTGMESLSGMSLDDVKVHHDSDKPAQLQAHAYAQGTSIHLGPGQEKHLPHEAWHVVQQKQGRVKPAMQMMGKVNINDDKGLEKEADVMGAKALQTKSKAQTHETGCGCGACTVGLVQPKSDAFIQKKEDVVQRSYAQGSPKQTGFDEAVVRERVGDMASSLKKTHNASLMGNYGKDYADNEIYISQSGAHAEEKIADDYHEVERDISIYTERHPCEATCNPMIMNDNDHEWSVNYTAPTGVKGRSAIYQEVKTDIATSINVSVKDLTVDDGCTTVSVDAEALKYRKKDRRKK